MSTRQTRLLYRLLFIFALPMFYILTLVLPAIASAALDVCKSGCAYSTIQSAINAAVSGDTIRVVQGTYTENLSISSKSNISLQGGYKDNTFAIRDSSIYTTIIDGQGTTNTIKILNSEGITMDGFTIANGQAFSGDEGGGINVESNGSKTNVTLSNNKISGNYADYGGGVSAIALNSGSTILNLNSNDVSMNRASQYGGGLAFNTDSSSTVEVYSTGNTISANQGDGYGNGLYINPVGSGSSITFVSNNDVIQNNKYHNSGGGGICAYVSSGASLSLFLNNARIDNNTSQAGGGIFLYPDSSTLTASITNSTISNNRGDPGGGVYIFTNNNNFSTFEFTENTISDNRAGNNPGGGIAVYASYSSYTLKLDKNVISGNNTLWEGQGIFIYNGWSDSGSSSLNLTLSANQILSNRSDELMGTNSGGGGIYLGNYATVTGTITNNVIANNSVSYDLLGNNYGGGIWIDNSGSTNLNFINNTVTGNYADDGGGGVYVSSTSGTAHLSFLNDIIYGNSGSPGSDIFNYRNSGSINISYSDIGTVFGSYNNGGGNLNTDPLFFDSARGDYHLLSNSPLIDKGTSSGAPSTDFEGDARPMGAGIDIGADEYNPNAFCNAANLDAEPEPLKLKREEITDETVTVTCENGEPKVGVTVTAKVTTGKKRISVSPPSAVTNASGQVTFTITAKKNTGNAKVRFEANGLIDNVSVKVHK